MFVYLILIDFYVNCGCFFQFIYKGSQILDNSLLDIRKYWKKLKKFKNPNLKVFIL